jgi:hypothetical protein
MSAAKKAAKPKPTRQDLAERIRALAEELRALETDDTRLAADLLRVCALPVQHFESPDLLNQRRAWTERLVGALNVMAANWSPDKKWWLPAAERAELDTAEALRMGHGSRVPEVRAR